MTRRRSSRRTKTRRRTRTRINCIFIFRIPCGFGSETLQERGSHVIFEKFSTYNLAAELSKFLRTLIANKKCKLAVAAKFSKWGQKNLAVFR